MSCMHPLPNNNLICSKGIYVQITMCQKQLNPLWKEPTLGQLQQLYNRVNVTSTKSEFVFTSTTGFLSGKVTDKFVGLLGSSRLQGWGARGTHQNSGQPDKTVGQCLKHFTFKTPPTWVVMIVQIMGKWEII
jgi:hypothetical protein